MRRGIAWLAALVPGLIGLVFALLQQSGVLMDPLLEMHVSQSKVLFAAGMVMSAVGLVIVALGFLAQHRQQRAIERGRVQAAEAHRRFVRQLDHELKSPLTTMRIELAELSSTPLADEQQEMIASVTAQAERLGRLCADLRKLGQLAARPLEPSVFDVEELLEEAVELAQQHPSAAERRLTVSVPQAPWPLPTVSGDRDLMLLAVFNLLDNALKFTRPGDSVEVRATEDGSAVIIEVADTGLGVPEDELPHIFEELYRGQAARGVDGSGMGLALVKAVVERHGGTLTTRSRSGQGSVFSLRLPVGWA